MRGRTMQILVDADACPVKELILQEAERRNIPVTMVTDTNHVIAGGYAAVVTVDQGADSVDIALANLAQHGDIVVTQDYGVAALALGKGARALNQNGLVYNAGNMDALLFSRYVGKKVRRAGGRTKGPAKRTAADDAAFVRALVRLLEE